MNIMSFWSIVFSSDSLISLVVAMIMATAITLIFKTQTTTNFAQTTIATFGAFIVTDLSYMAKINIWVALVIGLVICMGVGLFIDVMIIRKGRAVNAVGKQIITMGLTYVLLAIINILLLPKEQGAVLQMFPSTVFVDITKGFTVGDLTMPYNTVISLGISAIVLAILFLAIYKTKWGLGVRMTSSNETVAQMLGVNTHVITAISWIIAAALGCLGAVFTNNVGGKLSTTIMSSVQITAFLGCIVGGFTTFWGPLVATAILWALSNAVSLVGMVSSGVTNWKQVIVYALAMLLVLWKPNGLFGKVAKKKV